MGTLVAVDLAALVGHATDQIGAEAAARDITVTCDLQAAWVSGNRVLLERLAVNLVENAVRHNVDAGWVNAATASKGAHVTLTVRNSGEQIQPEEVPALFEPFRRLGPDRVDTSRGHGLGLSIVLAVATAHHGTVQAQALAGGGLMVVVSLPGMTAPGDEDAAHPQRGLRRS